MARLTYEWYIFVMKTGSVERCIGTRLKEDDGDLIEVYDQEVRTFSALKSGIVDRWQQERRVTKAGEQRLKAALSKISSVQF